MNDTKGGGGLAVKGQDWDEYKLLVLHQLESNAKGQSDLKKDLSQLSWEVDRRMGELSREVQGVKDLLTTADGTSATQVAQANAKRLDRMEWKASALGILAGSVPMVIAALIWWLSR